MSMNYGASIGIGYVIKGADTFDNFREPVPEVSWMESRYDPRTGERLADVKVVDSAARTAYVLDGKRYLIDTDCFCPFEFFEALAEKLNCVVGDDSFYESGRITFGLRLPTNNDDFYVSGMSCGGSVNLSTVIELQPALAKLRMDLRALGLKPNNPVVFIDGGYY